jgi:P-type conjugative transfer protein TrbJ
MNRLKTYAFAVLAVIASLTVTPNRARAQGIPVFDDTSFGELVSQLNQGAQQLTQLQNQLTAQLNAIKSLPGTLLPGVGQLAQQTQQLMQQINTIQNMGSNLQQQITSLYPTNFSNLNSVSGVLSELSSMQSQTRSAYQSSLQMQSQVAANQPQISGDIQSADEESMTASGTTAAVQASNQILGTLSQQLGDQQALLIAQYNAQAQQADEAQSENQAAQQAATLSYTNAQNSGPGVNNPFADVGQ